MSLAWEPFVISGLFPTYDYNKRTGILSGAQRKREGESNLANQEQKSICREIGARTGGDIYIGVVGPVRSGKSTFIKRFAELMLLPRIKNEARRARAHDELPQSAAGRTIMTTEPKFIPEKAVKLELSGGGSGGGAGYPEDGSAAQVRSAADSRMYETKQRHHENDRTEGES